MTHINLTIFRGVFHKRYLGKMSTSDLLHNLNNVKVLKKIMKKGKRFVKKKVFQFGL